MKVVNHAPARTNRSNPAGLLWATLKCWFPAFLIFNFSFLISACGLDVEDPNPPSPPVWVEKSLPEEWPERGIDAHESGGIFLEWEQNSQDNISAYILFRGQHYEIQDSLGSFYQIYRLDLSMSNDLSFLDSDVQVNTQYFYALRAEDISSNVSEFSDTVDYTLLPRISLLTMSPNALDDTLRSDRTLSWTYNYQIAMEEYCLTILNSEGGLVFRALFSPGNYVGGRESCIIPSDVSLLQGRLYRWRIDTGADYILRLENKGSESIWAQFVFSE